MWFRSPPDDLDKCDILLRPYLSARARRDAATRQEALFKDIELMCISKLKPRFAARDDLNSHDEQQEGFEDVKHTVIFQMLVRLDAMRREYQSTHAIQKPIISLCCYVGAVTSNAWKAYLRKIKPVFYQVYRAVRALLTNHKANAILPQMAVWEETQANGRKIWVGGLVEWRERQQPSECSAKLQRMLSEEHKNEIDEVWEHARQSAGVDVCDPLSHNGLYALFLFFNHPLTLNQLTVLLGRASGRMDVTTESLEGFEEYPALPSDENVSDFMRRFIECARKKLTPRERAAILLGGKDQNGVSLLAWVFEEGIASLRELAEMMEIPVLQLMKRWLDLPLDDTAIAEVKGCSAQGVRDARYSARAKIRKYLSEMTDD